MTVTNSGTPVAGAEVQLRTGDGTEVLHTTITGESGVAFFPMLPVADSYDLVASYYGETELSDDVAPAATPTEVSAAFNVTIDVTVATFWIEYAAGFDDVDTRLTVFDENLAQIAQASDHPNPPDPFFDQPYAHVTFSTAPEATIYIRVDVEPTPASEFEAPGYTTVFANLGTASTGGNIAVDAGNLPPDPGDDSATATPLSLDSYYPEHDSRYKYLFSHPGFVERLLTSFVDEPFVKEIDFTHLERVNASFVSEEFQQRESDIIWKLPLKGSTVYLFLLLEFQSTVDRRMPLRFLRYITAFYEAYLDEHPGIEKLPAVFPLLLYNGDDRWSVPSVSRK